MAIKSTKEFVGVPRDAEEHYDGNRIVYVSWDRHLLFAASLMTCVSKDMLLRDYLEGPIRDLLANDPDVGQLDFEKATWLKANQPWRPQFDKSLAENGVGHKEHLRFDTPGLNSYMPVD